MSLFPIPLPPAPLTPNPLYKDTSMATVLEMNNSWWDQTEGTHTVVCTPGRMATEANGSIWQQNLND